MTEPYGGQPRPDFAAPGQTPVVGPPGPQSAPYPGPGPVPAGGYPAAPGAYPRPFVRVVERPARPAMVTLSMVLIITGSLLLMCQVGLVWVAAVAARDTFGYEGVEGALYHLLNRFHLRMLDGLGLVLFGFPLAATVMAFFLLQRRSWPRIVISVLGLATIVATVLLLQDSPGWAIPIAGYILFSCLILWVPSVTSWCTTAPDNAASKAEPVAGRMAR